MSAPLLPARATGLLREFAAGAMLGPADVHVANRLGALAGETDERVLLAVALLVRSTRAGSVVLDLRTAEATLAAEAADLDDTVPAAAPPSLPWPEPAPWEQAVAASPLVDDGTGTGVDDLGTPPVRRRGPRLWLDRYWQQETQVAADLRARVSGAADTPDPLDPDPLDPDRLAADLAALFPAEHDDAQRRAGEVAARCPVAVVAGGPGTGKTTTVARLLAVLWRQRPGLRVALAAPTGRAAARLTEAVHAARDHLDPADLGRLASVEAVTLHRLLGRRPGRSSRFRHDRDNRLPFDLVVVDESSMIPVTMMARLLEALAPSTRLVLVGDPDQLASVEAGAVLGDLVGSADDPDGSPLAGAVATLTHVHRFRAEGPIAQLATAVRHGDAEQVLTRLRAGASGSAGEAVRFVAVDDDTAPMPDLAVAAVEATAERLRAVVEAARRGDAPAALGALDSHRLLCAHRGGPHGVQRWGDRVERRLLADEPLLVPRLDGHFPGQPLLVTANDYDNQLWNGDTGVLVERADGLIAAFRRGEGVTEFPLARLGDVRPLYASTVHKAQGSQYGEVTVVLPPAGSPLATRQTLYTAITRAREAVTIVGSEAAVRACVERPAARATGLQDRLAGRLQ